MYPLRNDVDLSLIIKKLGHDVEEIRVRTLKNLLSKLELKLLYEADLIQEQTLLIRLLEWFNFPSCSMKTEVLELIKTLSKHASASELLVGIGAVEFLSELRQDCDPHIQGVVDDILENLFKLPETDKSPNEPTIRRYSGECHYYPQKTEVSESSPYVIQDPIFDSPLSYFSPEVKYGSSLQGQTQGLSASLVGMRGVLFSTFPWLMLTPTDKHVLSSTNNSLCGSRQDVVKTSCDFLCDVVLQDFPAEIFLQRPHIIKSLLSILALRPPQLEDQSLIVKAIRCLSDLSQYLCERYHFYHDPDLYCPKQEFGVSQMSNASSSQGLPSQSTSQSNLSSNSRPSVIGHQGPRVGGDGKDWDSPSSDSPSQRSPVSEAESEDAISLQFSQVTLPQFCVDVLHRALSIYQDFTGLDVSSQVLPLVWKIIKLIKLSISSEIWSETGLSGRALIDRLTDSLELLADILIHSNRSLQETCESSEVIERYLSYVSLVVVTVELTVGLIPHSMSSSILPESLLSSFYQVVTSPFVSECLPHVQALLLPFLKKGNNQLLKTHEDCQIICQAMTNAAEFLRLQEEGGDMTSLLSVGELSLPALMFPETLPVVNKFVLLCSSLTADSSQPEGTEKQLLKFLLNPSTSHYTLTSCRSIVEESLHVSQAKDPSCSASCKVRFLLHPSLLKALAEQLSSYNDKMREAALSILLHLLTGRLLMTEDIWSQFITASGPSLALIQAQAVKNITLQHALRALLVHDFGEGIMSLTHLQQLRLSLRFLFIKDTSERTDLARFIMKYLQDERGSESKFPQRGVIIPEQISLLLLMEKPQPLEEDVGRSVFQVESLVQMFSIFKSSDTEESLRKSSADQLGIILQDHSLHQAFLAQGGLEIVLDKINSRLQKKKDNQGVAGFLASCGRILRLVVHHSTKIRHELAGQIFIYLTVLRCGLICQSDEKARRDFNYLLTLLLFDEVAGVMLSDDGGSEDMFCLPTSVKAGYQLPFSVPTWRKLDASPCCPQLPQDDPLAFQAVKVSWALGVHQGCDRLTKELMAGLEMKESPELGLSDTEKILLLYSHQPSAIKLTLRSIRTATSHYGVKQSLWQLAHWLSLEQSTLNRGENGICKHICETMMQEDLLGILQRFFEVTPSNSDDEVLLREIFYFLTVFLNCSPVSNPTNHFLTSLKAQLQDKTPLLELLGQSAEVKPLIDGSAAEQGKKNRKSGLLKQVLEFVSVFVQNLSQSSEAWMFNGQFIGSSLVSKLLHGLHLADEFHYYDLPSLEATLRCLMHITARSGWSLDWSDGDSYTLCQQMLRSLLEVVSAFHIGRGGIAISFMGKGVTRNASICLLHLSHEMSVRAPDKKWPIEWAHEIPGSTSSGLQWLVPLWSYRDPEVRASGLGIAVNLAATIQGCLYLSSCQEGLPGTLWTTVLSIICDHSECSVVRKQAVNLLINLLSHPISSCKEDEPLSEDEWAGPRLINQETQVSVSGKAALLALLNYFHLVPNVITILTYFYPQCTIQPVSVVDNSSAGSTRSTSGPSTVTTPDISDNVTSGQVHQQSDGQRVISPVLSDQSSTVPLIAASFQSDGPQPSSFSSEGTLVDGKRERAPSTVGYLSVVTPCLVASVCSLLNQLTILLPDNSILSEGRTEIIKLITGILDPNKAQSLSLANTSSLAAIQYLRMCTRGLELASVWLDKDLDLTKLLSRTSQLLHIQFEKTQDQAVKMNQHSLIERCFNLLTVCIQRGKHEEVLQISSLHWTHITATVIYLLKFSVPCSSRLSSFTYLAHILSVGTTPVPDGPITSVPDGPVTSVSHGPLTAALEAKHKDGTTHGTTLCNLLLSSYDGSTPPCLNHVQHERAALVAALKNLVAKSQSAKQTALDAGFVETLVEEIKRCHTKLTAESLLSASKRNKKKEATLLKQIKISVVILQNLMSENQDMKVAVKQAGFAQVLCKLWGWIQSTKSLLSLVLSALTVYTSHCITACLSLARSSTGQTSGTILNYLIKLGAHNPPELKVFQVITNCLWCNECRNIIWKSGFLSNLDKFQSLSCQSSKSQQLVQSVIIWLKLLVIFTFSSDGQQMTMKVKDIVELLTEFSKWPQNEISHLAILVIHNLCFLGANKNKMLSNELLLPALLAKFDDGDLREQFLVSSALWSAVHGNQKVKAILKAHSLQIRAREKLVDVRKNTQKPISEQGKRDLLIKHESVLTCLLRLLED